MKNCKRIKHALLLSLLLTPLAGCVPAAVMVGATAGGALIYDKRSLKTMGQDQTAEQHAQRWIDKDPVLKKKAHISVAVFDNVALLVGQAENEQVRNRASEIMAHIKHIRRTYNEITIAGNTTNLQRTSDIWITAKVKSRMLEKPGLNSNDIKIVTEDGVVYLMGSISRAQANLATNAARRVSGVEKVVRIFEYT